MTDKTATAAAAGFGCLMPLIMTILGLVGWVNHIIYCINQESWGFLIAGAIFFPIAVVHGWGLIFGWFG